MVVKRLGSVLGCAVIATASVAHAQVDNAGVLDKALRQYRTAAEGWQSAGQGAATTLFWSLATISLVWTMGQLVLRRAELGEFFGELVRYLLFTGFWAWMLNSGPGHARLIIESMIKLAGGASGQNMMSPSGVLDVGFHLVDRALTQSSILSPLDSAIGIVLALVILVVLALVAVNMLVTLIACWIVAYGGLIVLGFGGSRWTNDMAINYYRMVLSLGLQVLAMVLLVGIGESFLRGYYDALEKNVSLHEQAVLLVVSIVLLVTVNRVPALLGTLANGSSPQYALGSGAGAGAALSTASAAGALAATASRPVLEGAGQLAKAAAVAAIGGTGAAAASLLEGFRSRDAERSSSGGGGSVFPAPAPASGPAQEWAAQKAASASVPAEDSSRAPVPGERRERSAPAAEEASRQDRAPEHDEEEADDRAAATAPADSPRETPALSRSGDHDGGAEPSARAGAQQARVDGSYGGAAEPADPRAQERSAAAPNASEESTRTAPDSPSNTETPDRGGSTAPTQRSDASARRSAADAATGSLPSTSSPAGAFAQAPSAVQSAPAMTAGSPMASSAASTTAPAPRSTVPTGALAAAIRAAASPAEIPFSIATTGDAVKASAASPPLAAEPSDRADLPAAYSQQTSMDVEAEVAAFRDRD